MGVGEAVTPVLEFKGSGDGCTMQRSGLDRGLNIGNQWHWEPGGYTLPRKG